MDGVEFVMTIQEGFLTQYVISPTREGVVLDLVLGNEPSQNIEGGNRINCWSIDRHLYILFGHRDKHYKHLEANRQISDKQQGFVRGRSCFINLIEFFEEVTKMINEGKVIDIVQMDFSKVFDKVPHSRLLQKVKSNGIGWCSTEISAGTSAVHDLLNDLEETVASLISKFAEDVKIRGVMGSEEDC
eukprot:g40299.t1